MPLGLIFKPVFGKVMDPVIQISAKFISQNLLVTAINYFVIRVNNEVVPDLNVMLADVLTNNLTNILVDSTTHALTKSLALAFTRSVGPYLIHACDKIIPVIHVILDRVLKQKLPKHLNGFLPELLNRVLPLTLTHSLTRSVTHSLVPTLTHTLTHNKKADQFCNECYYSGAHCSLCHFSPESIYYQIYHSTYYSDWYSNYYADYYAEALMKLDAVQYPEFNGLVDDVKPKKSKTAKDPVE